MKTYPIRITSEAGLDAMYHELKRLLGEFGEVSIDVVAGEDKRTPTQNRCIHEYCEQLAQALNAAGLDMRVVMKPDAELPWTKESVKDNLWRSIQRAMYGKESTKEISPKECSEVYAVLDRHLSEKHGAEAHVEWPTRFSKAESRRVA